VDETARRPIHVLGTVSEPCKGVQFWQVLDGNLDGPAGVAGAAVVARLVERIDQVVSGCVRWEGRERRLGRPSRCSRGIDYVLAVLW
jgi:hypothetical protein